jgi:hypothetical protein
MVFPPLTCLNNMHGKPQDITTTIGSIHPLMLGKWHGAQFFTWSFQTFQSWLLKIKALDHNITLIFKIIFPYVTSNIVWIVCCIPLVHIGAFLGDIHIFKNVYFKLLQCWAMAKFSRAIGMVCSNNLICCSQVGTHVIKVKCCSIVLLNCCR